MRPLPLLVGLVVQFACSPASYTASDGEISYAFSYEMRLGRDCYMMSDCGYRLSLTHDGTLHHYDDAGEEVGSVHLEVEDRDMLADILNDHGFFSLPSLLPEVPQDEVLRGGRQITMTYENITSGQAHQIVAHTDTESIPPIPDSFHLLNESIRSFLLERLTGG